MADRGLAVVGSPQPREEQVGGCGVAGGDGQVGGGAEQSGVERRPFQVRRDHFPHVGAALFARDARGDRAGGGRRGHVGEAGQEGDVGRLRRPHHCFDRAGQVRPRAQLARRGFVGEQPGHRVGRCERGKRRQRIGGGDGGR